jgi:chromosome segregation ATPase
MERDAKLADAMKEAFDASADRIVSVHKDTADLNSKLVELLVATGQITPERGKVMDIEIQHAQKLQEFADARAKAAGDVSQAQSALGKAQQDFAAAGGGDSFHEEGIYKNKQYSDARADRLEKTISDYEKIQSDLKAAKAAAAADLKDHPLDANLAKRDQDLIDSLDNQADGVKGVYEKAKAELPDAERATVRDDKAWDDLSKAKESINKLTEQLSGLQQKIAELNASQKSQIPSVNQDFATSGAANLFKGGATIDSLVNAVNAPGGTAQHHQEAVQNLQIVLTSLGVSSADINAIVRGLMNHTLQNQTEIDQLKRQFEALDARIGLTASHSFSGS